MTNAAAGKPLTKSQTATALAQAVEGISKKQIAQVLEALTDLAYKQASNSFTIPGIGKLKLVNRPARKMIMQFGADKGKEKIVPASVKVKFSLSKAAKVAILNARK